MIINFKSKIDNNGVKNEIKFSSKVEISKYQVFDVFEFKEPSKNEMNRIEISDNKINIISGPSTIELELGNKIEIVYQIQNTGQINLHTMLHKLERDNNKVFFEYSLINENKIIGNYQIFLELKKE